MKWTVSMAVDGRIDVEVEAGSLSEAGENARVALCDIDWNTIDLVGISPVNAEDENENFYDF